MSMFFDSSDVDMYEPGRKTMNIPASLAASKMGCRARQSLKSTTPRDGFVAPTAGR